MTTLAKKSLEFKTGVLESYNQALALRCTLGASANDRKSFESALISIGVGRSNFSRWLNDDYYTLAIQLAWLGWQGKGIPCNTQESF